MKTRSNPIMTALALAFVSVAPLDISVAQDLLTLGAPDYSTNPSPSNSSSPSSASSQPYTGATFENSSASDSGAEYSASTIASGGGVGTDAKGLFDKESTIGAGKFEGRPWGLSLSLNQGWDDNIYTTHDDRQESFFTSASIGGYLNAANGRTSLKLGTNIGGSYYWDRGSDDFDPDINLTLALSHVFSPKWSLSVIGYVAYQSEPNFQTVYSSSRRGQDYVYGSVQTQLSQQWTRRFSTVYGYTVGGIVYTGDGGNGYTDGNNRIDQTFSLQLRYLARPTVTLVAEYRFGIVTYDGSYGDSTSHYILTGVDFSLNHRLSASFRAGAQIRNGDDGGSGTSPFVETSLSYQFAKHSTLTWVNRYGYEETNNGYNGEATQTYRTGLVVNHQFTPRLGAQLGAYYTTSDYDGGIGSLDTLDVNFNISYGISRNWSVQVGYTYTQVWSDDLLEEYYRNRVYAGATFSF